MPGLAVAVIKDNAVAFSKGYGWSNIAQQVAMTTSTIQNIGSVSKPVVTSMVMQCIERGHFSLGNDVNDYLPFPVRNPNHPEADITVLQLLTHTSSIADGSSYGEGYACGESKVALQEWIAGYFLPDGEFYNAAENFHHWAPGEKYEYNNVAFALLAYLVQVVNEQEFDAYCRDNLFAPLGMNSTTWFVANVDIDRHATPYAYVSKGYIDSPTWGGIYLGLVNAAQPAAEFEGPFADCIYDHPNFADGFLRSSVNDMSKFQMMLLGKGELDGERVLRQESVEKMLGGHGITWHERELPNGPTVWGHGGGDPGVSTLFDFRPEHGDGVIVFANTHGALLDATSAHLFTVDKNLFD